MDYHHYREALAETLAQSELPFPHGEYQARLDKVRRAMASRGVDALLLTDPPISITSPATTPLRSRCMRA